MSYFGTDGKPCLNKDGYAGWKAAFDERGNQTSVSYFGTDGKPCLHKDGYAGWKATFDERGKQDEHVLLRRRRQALPAQGRAMPEWKAHFDERGNWTSRSYFGTDGKPCLMQGRVCRMEGRLRRAGKRDERVLLRHRRQALPAQGRVCRSGRPPTTSGETRQAMSYFGTDGKPCLNKDGYAGWKATFDERGNQTSESYFGTDGKPCLCKDGYAEMRRPPSTSGETRRASPTSAPTASPA